MIRNLIEPAVRMKALGFKLAAGSAPQNGLRTVFKITSF